MLQCLARFALFMLWSQGRTQTSHTGAHENGSSACVCYILTSVTFNSAHLCLSHVELQQPVHELYMPQLVTHLVLDGPLGKDIGDSVHEWSTCDRRVGAGLQPLLNSRSLICGAICCNYRSIIVAYMWTRSMPASVSHC